MENVYKFRSNKITLIGDTHSTTVVKHLIETRILDGDDVVHLGDVGLGFGKISYSIDNALSWLDMLNKLCAKINVNLYLIRGNHDNPAIRIWGSTWSNVFLIPTEAYAEFPNGKKVLFLSGGVSIDRCVRKANIDYWYDEGTVPVENVEKCDILFSHDCPEEFNHSSQNIPTHWKGYNDKDPTLYEDCLNQRNLVGDIAERAGVNTIFYGHFHHPIQQKINNIYARCVDINELYFFDANKNYGDLLP